MKFNTHIILLSALIGGSLFAMQPVSNSHTLKTIDDRNFSLRGQDSFTLLIERPGNRRYPVNLTFAGGDLINQTIAAALKIELLNNDTLVVRKMGGDIILRYKITDQTPASLDLIVGKDSAIVVGSREE